MLKQVGTLAKPDVEAVFEYVGEIYGKHCVIYSSERRGERLIIYEIPEGKEKDGYEQLRELHRRKFALENTGPDKPGTPDSGVVSTKHSLRGKGAGPLFEGEL